MAAAGDNREPPFEFIPRCKQRDEFKLKRYFMKTDTRPRAPEKTRFPGDTAWQLGAQLEWNPTGKPVVYCVSG